MGRNRYEYLLSHLRPFENKCSSTEFAGSQTAALRTTVFFCTICLSHFTTLSIFLHSDLNTKTRGFRFLVIIYIRKKSDNVVGYF